MIQTAYSAVRYDITLMPLHGAGALEVGHLHWRFAVAHDAAKRWRVVATLVSKSGCGVQLLRAAPVIQEC